MAVHLPALQKSVPVALAFNRSGRALLTLCSDGEILVREPSTGSTLARHQLPVDGQRWTALPPLAGNRQIVVGNEQRGARILDLPSARWAGPLLQSAHGAVRSLAITPDRPHA